MNSNETYPGKELELFSQARNWKRYFSGFVLPYLRGRVLEVGAGTGNTTPYLNRSTGISSWVLLEPDPRFCHVLNTAIAGKRLPPNCTVWQGDIFSMPQEGSFDVILYIDVLEHIGDDHAEMDKAITLLKEGGCLIVLSPAFQPLYSEFDRAIGHFRRYNKATLQAIVDPQQMTTCSLRYLDSWSSLLSWGNRVLSRQSYPTAGQISLWDRFFVPLSRITDRFVFYNFGKTILGIWKKK